jgi:Rad3-related DNA helicase
MSILNYFPKDKQPREQQSKALKEIESVWNNYDVLCIDSPVAAGKSIISTTVAKWANAEKGNTSFILTPTKLLQEQYVKEVPDIPILKGKASYRCKDDNDVSCADNADLAGFEPCKQCVYQKDRKALLNSPTGILNYMLKYVLKQDRDILIIDEAHNVTSFLVELSTLKIWKHKDKYPDNIHSKYELMEWLEKMVKEKKSLYKRSIKYSWDTKDQIRAKQQYDKFERVFLDLQVCYQDFFIEEVKETHRGKEAVCLMIKPLILRNAKAKLWGKVTSKLILLSATINENDIKLLGLDTKRVAYIKTDSAIPKENRPVYIVPVTKFNFKNRDESAGKIAKAIEGIMKKYPKDKGVIHCTYSTSKLLFAFINNKRLLSFDAENREEVYKKFLKSKNKVLLAPACQEGLDLKGDLARFQILAKINFPSLASNYIKKIIETDEKLYTWEAVRSVLQAYGRIVRTPEDHGDTYIIDSSFLYLYNKNKDMFADWFKEAVIFKHLKEVI